MLYLKTLVLELRVATFGLPTWLNIFGVGTSVVALPLWNLGLCTWCGNLGLGMGDGHVGLGTLEWDLCVGDLLFANFPGPFDIAQLSGC